MSKDSTIQIRLSKEMKEAFEELCKEKCTTPSHELRLFIDQKLKGRIISKEQYVPKWKRERGLR